MRPVVGTVLVVALLSGVSGLAQAQGYRPPRDAAVPASREFSDESVGVTAIILLGLNIPILPLVVNSFAAFAAFSSADEPWPEDSAVATEPAPLVEVPMLPAPETTLETALEIVTEPEAPWGVSAASLRPVARPLGPAIVVAEPEQPSVPAGSPLTLAEKESWRVAVQRCWNVGSLSSEALGVSVVVTVSMQRDGRPEAGSIRMADYSGGSDAAARQAFEAARRAIIRCGVTGYDLPKEKYEQWREIEMTFNPERMRIR